MNVAPVSVVVRYGDSNEFDFCVLLDPAVPLGEALDAELRRAMKLQRLTADFAIDDYTIECRGTPVDRSQSVRDMIEADETLESGLLLVLRDVRAPIRIVTLCKHDQGLLRAQFDADPSQTLESTISGNVGDLEKIKFGGRTAVSWRYRRSLAPPKGFRRRLAGSRSLNEQGVRSNEMIELKPGLKTVWHPKRPRTIAVQVVLLGLVAYLIWVATANQVQITIDTGDMPAIVELMDLQGNVVVEEVFWPETEDGPLLQATVSRTRYIITGKNPVYPIIKRVVNTPSRWRPWAKANEFLQFSAEPDAEQVTVTLEAMNPTRGLVFFPDGKWLVNGAVITEDRWLEWLADNQRYKSETRRLTLAPGIYEFAFHEAGIPTGGHPSSIKIRDLTTSRLQIILGEAPGMTGWIQLGYEN